MVAWCIANLFHSALVLVIETFGRLVNTTDPGRCQVDHTVVAAMEKVSVACLQRELGYRHRLNPVFSGVYVERIFFAFALPFAIFHAADDEAFLLLRLRSKIVASSCLRG